MQPQPSDVRSDLDAALAARRDLGPEYESELIDSFLARVDARLDARVEQRVAERLADYDREARYGSGGRPRRRRWSDGGSKLPYVSLVMAVPLTGIGMAVGITGVLLTWAGIVGVNVAAAFAQRFEREERRADGAARSEWA
jgi:hypothetical protein